MLNYLPGLGEEAGQALVNHPEVDLIAFTGSRDVGLLINRQAAVVAPGQDHVKRVIAEMGGKNAIMVDDDADLDEAVVGVIHERIRLCGPEVLGVLASDRARRELRRVPGSADRGGPRGQDRAGRRSRDGRRTGDRRPGTQPRSRIPADRRGRGPGRLPGQTRANSRAGAISSGPRSSPT